MKLNEIKDNKGARYKFKRLGRGEGSGKGKTCGRNMKGQKARSGVSIAGFEGGQNPLYMRLPKRGFHNLFAKEVAIVNLGQIEASIQAQKLKANGKITQEDLVKAGVLRRAARFLKILSKGEIKSSIEIHADFASESAIKALEKQKGKFVQIVTEKL